METTLGVFLQLLDKHGPVIAFCFFWSGASAWLVWQNFRDRLRAETIFTKQLEEITQARLADRSDWAAQSKLHQEAMVTQNTAMITLMKEAFRETIDLSNKMCEGMSDLTVEIRRRTDEGK